MMSPDTPPLATEAAAEARNTPPVASVQNETWLMVSVAFNVNSGVLDKAIAPPVAAAHVQATRVVWLEALAVPFAPGSPVCSLAYTVVGGVQVLLRNAWSSSSLASVAEIPVAIQDVPLID
ncbi:hypothetical protein [Mycobacterium phage MKC-IRE-02]